MFTKNALVWAELTGLYWLRFSAALGHRHLLMHPSVVTTVRTPRHTQTPPLMNTLTPLADPRTSVLKVRVCR